MVCSEGPSIGDRAPNGRRSPRPPNAYQSETAKSRFSYAIGRKLAI
jgi:hypothetical protein